MKAILILVFCFLLISVYAQNYKFSHGTFNAGGGHQANTLYSNTTAFGEYVLGEVSSTDYTGYLGFLFWQDLDLPTPDPPAIGDGSSGNPYQITSLENLYWISVNMGEWDKHYIQIADIDASPTSGWTGGEGFTPIGDNSINFTGSYDGQGHLIDGLFINRAAIDYIGLFGYIDAAEIDNIGITNGDITGNYYVGSLVGRNHSSSSISNSYATGTANGLHYVGGLVGYNDSSSINNNFANVSVTGIMYVGGLIGSNYSTVSNCYTFGSVIGDMRVGGLIGSNPFLSELVV